MRRTHSAARRPRQLSCWNETYAAGPAGSRDSCRGRSKIMARRQRPFSDHASPRGMGVRTVWMDSDCSPSKGHIARSNVSRSACRRTEWVSEYDDLAAGHSMMK